MPDTDKLKPTEGEKMRESRYSIVSRRMNERLVDGDNRHTPDVENWLYIYMNTRPYLDQIFGESLKSYISTVQN